MAKSIKKITLIGFSYLPSALKIFLYRLLGANIGNKVEIGLGSVIIPFDSDFKKICISEGVVINDHVHILSKHLYLGTNSKIKRNTRIWGQSDFVIGKGTHIESECHFDLRRNIVLENEVTISGGCWFFTHMVFRSILSGAPVKLGPITIQERTYLGANVLVLPDITIGNNAIIGAGAVVTKNVNPDSIMVGNPAREIGKTSQKIKKLTLEDKIEIVKDILLDFMHVYNEKITLVKKWDNNELIFLFQNQAFFFVPKINRLSVIHKKMKETKKPVTLISFSIPEEIIADCNNNDISWFDMNSNTKSSQTNKNDQIIERFLGNYAIKLSN